MVYQYETHAMIDNKITYNIYIFSIIYKKKLIFIEDF